MVNRMTQFTEICSTKTKNKRSFSHLPRGKKLLNKGAIKEAEVKAALKRNKVDLEERERDLKKKREHGKERTRPRCRPKMRPKGLKAKSMKDDEKMKI